MDSLELTKMVAKLVQSPYNMQEFADLASLEENWKKIDKSAVKMPREVGLEEEECLLCEGTIRFIYDKFTMTDCELDLRCPHCHKNLKCVGEFSGYTTEFHLEEE